MKKSVLLLALIVLLFQFEIFAQKNRNANEAAQNKEQLKIDEATLKQDNIELDIFKVKLVKFEKAYLKKNFPKVKALKIDIISDIHREIEQSEIKIEREKLEAKQSKNEVKSESKEIRKRKGHNRGDRYDKRDDERDLKDDLKDLEKQIDRTNRQKAILETIELHTFGFTEVSLGTKKLLHEFAETMEDDIAATKREIQETIAEQEEDKRERQEDRRGRKKKKRRFRY
ncbi:MAG: hypothetical protein HN704_15860 [Bacteroidetes bacterium]|jgi:hypothetical protein|nr:hypothetical protein [Bacteroidota bacterium]MBT6687273.1 hypothetical protein [Bacteroidota bacterium]MBT7144506.1 hypothetical protein [Bacteroidota bacterium]MBT7493073.1 hypothetical protein [Bacteroidota bacterium]